MPLVLYLPGVHAEPLGAGETDPGGHKKPAAQSLQKAAPGTELYFPAAHMSAGGAGEVEAGLHAYPALQGRHTALSPPSE